MDNLIKYLKLKNINFNQLDESSVKICNKSYELIKPVDGLLFDEEFSLFCEETYCDNYIFSFGGKYYWTPKGSENHIELNEVKYLGKIDTIVSNLCFLGIRGGYELLNGSRLYEDWVKKAKFLGIKSLGICEKNTLSGVLKFQLACQKENIIPIIGETCTIYNDENNVFDLKLYVKNEKGWLNLLQINKEILINNQGKIHISKLMKLKEDLIIVIDPKYCDFDKIFPLDFDDLYYQLDTVIFENEEKDHSYLDNLKKFVNSRFKPTSIIDAFYLEKEDYYIKPKLNLIGKKNDYFSKNQYFKSKEDYFIELSKLFNQKDDRIYEIFEEAISNELKIAYNCKFLIDVKSRHLPSYEMTKNEFLKYKTKEDLFWGLIYEGLLKKVDKKFHKKYLKRIDYEYKVIKEGNVLDYFLITHDIINWAHNHNIITGIGRGSSSGSVISYLLNIVYVDPIEFNLLFERFLNVGRIGTWIKDDLIIIETDEGEKKLWWDKMVIVIRNGHRDYIMAQEIKENDILEIY